MPLVKPAIAMALSAAALTALAVAPAHAAPVCPPSQSEVVLDLSAPPPMIDNSLAQPTLQGLAGKAHHGGRTLGLYTSKLKAGLRVGIKSHDSADETCRWIEGVRVELRLTDRIIYVIRERKPGTCGYEVVLEHERKHEAVDDAVLREHIPRLRAAVERAIAGLPEPRPVPRRQGATVDKQMFAAVEKALDRAVAELQRDLARRQNAIDTPAEYQRVGAACG